MKKLLLITLIQLNFFSVVRLADAAGPDQYDLFYGDQTSATLNRLTINIPQTHVISTATDEDWAFFYGEDSMPYTIKAENVASGLDVAITFLSNGVDAIYPERDLYGFGHGESITVLHMPSSGMKWIRVRATALQEGPTSYTLIVTSPIGVNVGLATVSGIKRANTGQENSVTLASNVTIQRVNPVTQMEEEITTIPLYTKSYCAWTSGTFTVATSQDISLGGLGDPIQNLVREWVLKWNDLCRQSICPNNLTITSVALAPSCSIGQPLEIGIQMRDQTFTGTLSDDSLTWPQAAYQDIPADWNVGSSWPAIYRWNFVLHQWEMLDARPDMIKIGNEGWLAVTKNVQHCSWNDSPYYTGFEFFAAMMRPTSVTNVRRWQLYE